MKNILLLGMLFLSTLAFSQTTEESYKAFIKETQITDTKDGNMDIVWWIPTEFWEIALSRSKDITDEQRESLIKLLY